MAGCGRDIEDGPVFLQRDSLGVVIAESSRPGWGSQNAWSVEHDPVLRIGSVAGDDVHLLDRITGAIRLEDGGVVVANAGDNTIRHFDAQGQFVWQTGGTGGGPNEFDDLVGLQRRGSELWAYDAIQVVKVFDLAGVFSRSIDARAGAVGSVIGVLGNVALILVWPPGYPPQPGVFEMNARVFRVDTESGSATEILERTAERYVNILGTGQPQAFSPTATFFATDSVLYYNFPDSYEISVFDDDGVLLKSIRRDWDPRPVTRSDRSRYEQSLLDLPGDDDDETNEEVQRLRRRMATEMVFAEHHPAHGRLQIDALGNLWVEQPSPGRSLFQGPTAVGDTLPTPWDVFDAAGAWMGSVELPPRFSPTEIGDDHIVGVSADELGVEFVQVHRIVKP